MTTTEFAEDTTHRRSEPSVEEAEGPVASSPDAASPAADLAVIQRRASSGARLPSVVLLRAQRAYGNRIVQRAVAGSRSRSVLVQRKCECGGTCPKCREAAGAGAPAGDEAARVVQTRMTAPTEQVVPDDVIPASSMGEPLDEKTRETLEPHFDRDLSGVRVHTDAPAAQAAHQLGADAFTTGSDIYFAEGRYAPDTREGRHLLAHEVAHTVQQGDGQAPERAALSPSGSVVVGATDDRLEREADAAADVAAGERAGESVDVTPDRSGQVRRRSAREYLGAAWSATGGRVGGWARAGWRATGGRAVRWVGEKVEETIEWVRDWLEEHAPTLMEFLRNDPIEILRRRIGEALDGVVGGVLGRIRKHGLFGALASLIGEGATMLGSALASVAADPCRALRAVVEAIISFQRWQLSTAWTLLSKGASAVAGFFSTLWSDFAKPAWQAVEKLAGKAWAWIKARAQDFWDFIKPLRELGARIWRLAKRAMGVAWDKGTDLFDWIKEKAEAAWNKIKAAVQPFLGPLKVIGAVLLLLSPLGPVIVIGAAAYGLYQGARWLYNNWDRLDIVVKARQVLRQRIIPAILSAVDTVRGALDTAVKWLGEQAAKLSAALAQLADAVGVTTLLKLAKSAVLWIKGKIDAFAAWASGTLKKIADAVKPVLTKLRNFFQPIFVALLKLAIVVANPLLWPIYISALVWMALPDCVKPPIIDYILDLLIAAIRKIPEFRNFGETWPQIRAGFLRGLEEVRGGPMERKLELSNRVANMIAGGDLEGYGNLIEAARQMPEHFVGQAQEELLGMNLGEPLPFEVQPEGPTAAAALPAAGESGLPPIQPIDTASRRGAAPREEVDVSHVAPLALTGELLLDANLGDGSERTFGDNPDPANSLEAIREELAAAAETEEPATEETPGTVTGTLTRRTPADAAATPPGPGAVGEVTETVGPQPEPPAGGETAPAPTAAMTPEEQLAMLMADETPIPCETPAGEKKAEALPANQRTLGPFTPSQRGAYMWHQLKRGIAAWYECNKVKVWAAIITAVVLLVIDLFLTGGATFTTLMEVIGAIFIGIAIVRIVGYVAEYIAKSILGDIAGAAKALARGLAAGAIEIVFALMFSAGAILKRIKAGAVATLKAMERVAPRAAAGLRAVGRGAAGVVRTTAGGVRRAGAATVAGVRRVAGAVLRRGRIILDGLPAGFSRGVRSLDDLARRLWARLRFRRFKLTRRGWWIQLWGEINPWILLAQGNLRYVDESAVTGVKQGEKTAVQIGDELIEGVLVRGGSKPDYRFIADHFAQQAVSDINVIHHAIEQQVLKNFKGLFTVEEINAVWNLRTVLKGAFNSEVHLSKIRRLWNAFYPAIREQRAARSMTDAAVKDAFHRFRSTVDDYIAHMTRFMETNPAAVAAAAKGDTATVRALLEAESEAVLKTPKFLNAVSDAIQ